MDHKDAAGRSEGVNRRLGQRFARRSLDGRAGVVARSDRDEVFAGEHRIGYVLAARSMRQRSVGPDEMIGATVTAVDEDEVLRREGTREVLLWRERLERAVGAETDVAVAGAGNHDQPLARLGCGRALLVAVGTKTEC